MCGHCRDGQPLQAVTYSGRSTEGAGHYVISGRKLLIYDRETMLQDRVEIRFCPSCGTLIPPEEVAIL